MSALLKRFPFLTGEIGWLLIFIFASIGLRFFSFFPSELDHDESTYAIIGNEILKGKALYTEVTDTKPVGIFLVYAGLQYLFGYSIFMKRLFAAVVVGVSCFIIKKVSEQLFSDEHTSNAAGIVYLFYSSMWVYFGLSPNTELYFNLFTISALFFLLRKGNLNFLIGGLLAGTGFMFKYLVLLDYAAFMLFFLVVEFLALKGKFKVAQSFKYLLSGIGFLTPFALTALYFYAKGRFADFYFISFELPGLYKESSSFLSYLTMMGDLLLRFFPITFFFAYVLIRQRQLFKKEQLWFFGLWIMMVLWAMYLPGKGFSHYTIQLMLPLSLLAGLFFHSTLKPEPWLNFMFRGKSGIVILVAIILIIETAAFFENVVEPDSFKEVATYLEENLSSEEQVFVSNYEPIIYYLLKRETPTKYVHANLLFTDLHEAFRFDNLKEIQRIMDLHPKFVLIQYENEIMEEMMADRYVLDRTFRNDEILVYRLVGRN